VGLRPILIYEGLDELFVLVYQVEGVRLVSKAWTLLDVHFSRLSRSSCCGCIVYASALLLFCRCNKIDDAKRAGLHIHLSGHGGRE